MLLNSKSSKKVFVGMSGGVDSSVSAALLKKAGYDVTGVFIKTWHPDFVECTWREDRLDAMRVCAKLDIPFVTLDLEKEYKRDVADYMIAEYKAGRTPNPDVMCNKYVKFGAFFDWAMEQGADFVATGHYAKIVRSPEDRLLPLESTDIFLLKNSSCSRQSRSQVSPKAIAYLLAGDDRNKDQSYFLWTLTQKQLSKTLFPIGDIEKPEVRKLAKRFGLNTAVKKDSQGVCFLGEIDIKEFLKNYIKEKPGNVLSENEKVIGKHDGAFFLTIGQRHGFTITQNLAKQTQKNAEMRPYYIISKDIKNNTITVSQDPNLEAGRPSGLLGSQASKLIKLEEVSWTCDEPDLSKKYSARIRYRQPLEECTIVKSKKSKDESEEYELHFTNPQKAITSGQSAVIYDREVCLGGGTIEA